MEKIIKVIGKGTVKQMPTNTNVIVTFTGKDTDYTKLVARSAKDLQEIKDLLAKSCIDTNAVRTKSYNIEPSYTNVTDKKGKTTRVFDGFAYSQTLSIKFKCDNKKLGDILFFISSISDKCRFEVRYELDDGINYRDELLKSALEDAKHQVDLVCKATGATIDSVANVTYGVDDYENDFRVDCLPNRTIRNYDLCTGRDDFDVEIIPEDIEMFEQVRVTYLLK